MPRAFTGPQRAAIAAQHFGHHLKFEIQDSEAAWWDATDWLVSLELQDNADANTWGLSARLVRDNGSTASLAPLRSDSTINRDSLDGYAPKLDLVRRWRASFAVTEHDASPGSFVPFYEGYVDRIEVHDPEPVIDVIGRDLGARLLDHFIPTANTYTSIALETLIRGILDDNGFTGITLSVPASPSFVITQHTPEHVSVMQAINDAASLAGFVVRYRYNASNQFLLTLYAPNRDAVAEDWTVGPGEYVPIPVSSLDVEGIRNRCRIRYQDSTTNAVEEVVVEDEASILDFNVREIQFDFSVDTQITTAAQVTAVATAVVSDLALPPMEQTVSVPGFWIASVGDYGRFLADGVHYDGDQFAGVYSVTHRWENATLMTTLGTRGRPVGTYRKWHELAARGGLRGVVVPVIPPSVPQVQVTFNAGYATISLLGVTNTRSFRLAYRKNGNIPSVADVDAAPAINAPNGTASVTVGAESDNLIQWSEEFDNEVWEMWAQEGGSAPIVTPDDAIAPDGTMTADKVVFDVGSNTNSWSIISQEPPIISGLTYARSIYMKAASPGDVGKKIQFRAHEFSFSNITLTNSWQRITPTPVAATTDTGQFWIALIGAFQLGTVSVHLWGAQMEQASAATDYQPSTTSGLFRAGDVLNWRVRAYSMFDGAGTVSPDAFGGSPLVGGILTFYASTLKQLAQPGHAVGVTDEAIHFGAWPAGTGPWSLVVALDLTPFLTAGTLIKAISFRAFAASGVLQDGVSIVLQEITLAGGVNTSLASVGVPGNRGGWATTKLKLATPILVEAEKIYRMLGIIVFNASAGRNLSDLRLLWMQVHHEPQVQQGGGGGGIVNITNNYGEFVGIVDGGTP